MRDLLRQGSLLAGGYILAATLFLSLPGKPLIAFLYTPPYLPAYPALVILLARYAGRQTPSTGVGRRFWRWGGPISRRR